MRSLRGWLLILWLMLLASAAVTGYLLIGSFRQSAAAQVGRAQELVARSCRDIADRYAFATAGWNGPPSSQIDEELQRQLTVVVAAALAGAVGVEGGIWQSQAGSLAYAFPTYEGSGPKTDLPEAEHGAIEQVNADARRDEQPVTVRRPLTAFREEIRNLGYIEGQTIALDFRLSKGIMDALPALAAELVRIPVNVIVTDTTSATLAAFDATRTIPIVMGTTGADPVALGLAKSISRPGGNVTGAQMLTGLSQKRLQLLKQAFPDAEHIAVLSNPKDEISVSEMPKAEMAAAQMGVHLIPFVASAPAELRALEPSALSHSDGLLVMPGGMFWNNRATIIGIAAMARVPAIYPEREYADDGGLIAYGPNPVVHFRLAARYVDRILRGANPGDLPINASSQFDFVINLRTAHALGIALSPDFVSAANEVIE